METGTGRSLTSFCRESWLPTLWGTRAIRSVAATARQDEKVLNAQGAVLQTVLDQGSLDDAMAGASRRNNDMSGRGESARRYAAADSRMITADDANVMFAEEALLIEAGLKIRQIAHCQIHLPTLERLARGLRRHG